MSENTLRNAAIAAVVLLLFFLLRPKADIEAKEARALVAGGGQLVDVRTPGEYTRGHIDGARNIPVGQLQSQLGELDKTKPVILYCQSGARSARAAKMLKGAGFTRVHNLGSIANW